jgi:hypothetical protein
MRLSRVHLVVAIVSWLCAALAAVVTAAVRDLQIVTPLQALTIPDGGGFEGDATELSRRQAFLERFQAGIEAEMKVLDRKNNGSTAGSGLDFLMDKEAERAFATATQAVASRQETRRKLKKQNGDGRQQQQQKQYQFVGVIQPVVESSSSSSTAGGSAGGGPAISWYARPKPKDARWSMRLVHVNREAVIKHLFDQGKVDIYGKYQTVTTDAATSTTGAERLVEAKYTVTPRSWR